MKRRLMSALCLLLVSLPMNGIAISQTLSSKKRAVEVPMSTDLSREIVEAGAYTSLLGNGVVVNWKTTREIGIAGFNLYRIDAEGKRSAVNDSLIAGTMMLRNTAKFPEASGGVYSQYDPNGNINSRYYIESVNTNGATITDGPLAPQQTTNFRSKMTFDPQERPDRAAGMGKVLEQDFPVSLSGSAVTPIDNSANRSRNADGKTAGRTAEDPVNQKWVAAQPGVKLQVRQNGMYRVTRSALQAAGFNVNASPDLWQLYVDGSQVKMIVEPSGNYIEFYGTGIDIENSDSRYYYLLVGPSPGQRIASTYRRPFSPNIQGQYFQNSTLTIERLNYLGQFTNGDETNWFGVVLGPSAPVARTVNLPNVNFAYPTAEVEVSTHGFLNGLHRVQVSLNGNVLGNLEYDGVSSFTRTFTVNTSILTSGTNNFSFSCLNGPSDFNLLKHIKVTYPRGYVAVDNRLAFDSVNQHATKVTGFDTSNVRVFTLSRSGEPQLIINTSVAPGIGGFDVTVPSGRNSAMIAVADNALLSPVAITPNVPSQLSAGTSNADMVIISHGNFMAGANDWAAYREADGLNVDVVNVEDVYDEFDYGLPTPAAIRNYLQYADTNYPNLKYAFLIGDATYDPRNFTGSGYNDFIPTKFVNTSVGGESPSDEWLGDFTNDSVAEIAIGRLPVRASGPIATVLAKLTVFEANIENDLAQRGVLFVADEPNTYPFPDVNRLLAEELPKGTPVEYVDRPENPDVTIVRTRLISEINEGYFIVNYTGHGSPALWSSSQMLRITDVPQMVNSGDKLSMFFMLTCLNGSFTDPVNDWLAEAILKSPVGGAPVVWSSTGSTTPDIQQIMATRFFDLLGQGTHQRLGDAIRESKLEAPNPDIPLTWALFGDPSMNMK